MFDDLAAYFHENVVAAYEEYLHIRATQKAGRSSDVRSGITAASALYHFREHLPCTYPKTRADVVLSCPDYALLGDVVNASKHRNLTRGTPQLANAGSIEEQVLLTVYEDEFGRYQNIEKEVAIKLSDGSVRILLEITTNVMNFWLDELHSIGVISKRAHYSSVITAQPLTRDECTDGEFDLEMTHGLRFKQVWCLRKYNYSTGKIEPENLTGATVNFGIYQPKYDVDVFLRNDSTGQEITQTISLSVEESEQLGRLKNEEDQQKYLIELPQVAAVLTQLFSGTKTD